MRGWRQHRHLTRKVKRLFERVCTARRWHSRPEAVAAYLDLARELAARAAVSLRALAQARAQTVAIEHFLRHVRLLADQIERRLLKGEAIAQDEKVFSVFEEHTRWIGKGKAGQPVELGVPVCVVEDRFQFILEHRILWQGGDVDVAVPLIETCQTLYPDLRACSFDRGFHSPANRVRLDDMPELNALPKKGRLNRAERAREADEAFAAARRQHPAVESAINNLGHRGLERVRAHGAGGFERMVGLSVVAANLHRIGLIAQRRERARLERRRRRVRAA